MATIFGRLKTWLQRSMIPFTAAVMFLAGDGLGHLDHFPYGGVIGIVAWAVSVAAIGVWVRYRTRRAIAELFLQEDRRVNHTDCVFHLCVWPVGLDAPGARRFGLDDEAPHAYAIAAKTLGDNVNLQALSTMIAGVAADLEKDSRERV